MLAISAFIVSGCKSQDDRIEIADLLSVWLKEKGLD